jgi:hypothetical protein
MARSLSAKTDKSSIRYYFDDFFWQCGNFGGMKDAWFKRFVSAIDACGKSYREISLAAKLRPGYLHDVITKNQDPSVTRFMAICQAAGISPLYVLLGIERTPDLDELETIFSQMDEAQREAFLSLLDKMVPGQDRPL